MDPSATTARRFGSAATSGAGLKELVDHLGEIDAREISTIPLGDGMVVRVGRYGPYVEETVPAGIDPATGELTAGGEVDGIPADWQPRRATITDDVAPDEMTPAKARELAKITDLPKFIAELVRVETQVKTMPKPKTAPQPERVIRGSGPLPASSDKQLDRLRAEADKTGDRTKVAAYLRQKQTA